MVSHRRRIHLNYFGVQTVNLFKNVIIHIYITSRAGHFVFQHNHHRQRSSPGRLAGLLPCLACIFAADKGAAASSTPSHPHAHPVVFIWSSRRHLRHYRSGQRPGRQLPESQPYVTWVCNPGRLRYLPGLHRRCPIGSLNKSTLSVGLQHHRRRPCPQSGPQPGRDACFWFNTARPSRFTYAPSAATEDTAR